jgi:hypothetical protein
LVDACLTQADGHAEDFVNELRSMQVTPHVVRNISGRRSAIDGRTARDSGYSVSLRIRKRIEEALGWIRTVAGQRKSSSRGSNGLAGPLPSLPPPTIWCGCPKLIAETG